MYGAVTRSRERAPTTDLPTTDRYVDALAALVPAEVLALHALVVSVATDHQKRAGKTVAVISQAGWLKASFFLLIGLSMFLYSVGHFRERWQPWNWLRMLLPPGAFVAWCLIQPTTAWDAIAPGMPMAGRVTVGAVAAVVLGALAAALAGKASETPPPKPATPA
jgi:hypothetical protein